MQLLFNHRHDRYIKCLLFWITKAFQFLGFCLMCLNRCEMSNSVPSSQNYIHCSTSPNANHSKIKSPAPKMPRKSSSGLHTSPYNILLPSVRQRGHSRITHVHNYFSRRVCTFRDGIVCFFLQLHHVCFHFTHLHPHQKTSRRHRHILL